MNRLITVREHAWLTTDCLEVSSLDRAQISKSAFEFLCGLSASLRKSGASLVQESERRWLRLDNYVGVIETPCGTSLEILPKHIDTEDRIKASRALLRTMIGGALELPAREVGVAHLQLFNVPFSEWVAGQFLRSLDHLIKRGIRIDYNRVEEEQRYLRGQLHAVRQMRQPPERRHYFQICHDVFLPDCAENRLLKLALDRVCNYTRRPENWRLANELRHLLYELPISNDVKQDFANWRDDRLMAHYRPVKPWCELLLKQRFPFSVVGDWKGTSFLFPMERLFESYVASCLRRTLNPSAKFRLKPSHRYLCDHDGGKKFFLEPDFVIDNSGERWVLDAKWKRINQMDRANNYDLSQSDFYQLFAYGQKYLEAQSRGNLILIYPKSDSFNSALAPFDFSDHLRLWVLPFDLDAGELEQFHLADLPLVARVKIAS
jgi:5-methylcytosine-specific restriction enzyme subunit McrC